MIITNGKNVQVISDIFDGEYTGTLFLANENPNFQLASYVLETIG